MRNISNSIKNQMNKTLIFNKYNFQKWFIKIKGIIKINRSLYIFLIYTILVSQLILFKLPVKIYIKFNHNTKK
jgi:hypothetical protein